jgi:hypothetical protein
LDKRLIQNAVFENRKGVDFFALAHHLLFFEVFHLLIDIKRFILDARNGKDWLQTPVA